VAPSRATPSLLSHPGIDLDLHLVHPRGDFGDPVWDCDFDNPVPEWGVLDQLEDDCLLYLDDNDGAGPERITMAQMQVTEPFDGPYLIGVHYYAQRGRQSDQDFGASTATLRVFTGPHLIFEAASLLESQGTWWVVGEVHYDEPGAEIRTVLRDTLHDETPVARP
jgi:uncharacterized protein YfaP (DUF2135 family)